MWDSRRAHAVNAALSVRSQANLQNRRSTAVDLPHASGLSTSTLPFVLGYAARGAVSRLVAAILFLVLVDEGRNDALYADHMFAPFHWVHGVLLEGIFGVRPLDVLFLGVLVYGTLKGGSKVPSVRPMRRSLFVAASVIAMWVAYGLLRGGDANAAGWQVYLILSAILVSFAIASIFKTAEQYIMLMKVVVAAGVYRAFMCIIFYWSFLRNSLISPVPEYATTHDDTVLWTVSIAFLLLSAILLASLRNRVTAAVVIPLLLVAVQINNRRLAWISILGSLVTLYFLLPPSAAKKRARRIVFVVVPVLAIYAAVGWGRPEPIFQPLRAFATVSVSQDNSTKARNVENLGLIATANQGWLLGSGWGQKYVEVSDKYNIHFFELWPYIPHNSILGLLAYTGYFGFIGFWMIFPTAAFFHARTATYAVRVPDRLIGMTGVVQVLACADQWYGDMGSFSTTTMYTLAMCFAAAMRIPVLSPAWLTEGSKSVPAKSST
jgi:O-Antigen ligase